MEKFASIYQRAAERKGSKENLESLLSRPLTAKQLSSVGDDRWLAAFTMKVFQCGISWQVVRNKWPNFEAVFFDFKIDSLLMLSEEQWEAKAKDPQIIRHLTKVMSIPANAQMIKSVQVEHGSFSEMVSNWPENNITGLWLYLKKQGNRLGGNTGPYTLRQMGVDTFIFSSDVESYLRNTGIIDSGRGTKRALSAANNAFLHWQQESGRSLTEISQTIAYSGGDNRTI
ncbi:DNA-3-methyladenine glycosylase I [Vibrio algarum]|uniref:DNA-3-methyladenine glycosylase I n=1 Tax=Vibrio algarum TaxID=3020714 RepID=A0ABT4YQI7_9VIBR|nr:DNA-3-methyladenine glycosylase I [Vibrio sp. KJ40-1]MDB1123818.1 DNA-3-methyladenine glycosylase I [Vibrio sp. KJ40-1]